MLLIVVFAAAAGSALAVVALYIQHASDVPAFRKLLTDLLLKLSIFLFGVSIVSIAFFGQRWMEDINKQIDEANEALGNLDIIQAKYMAGIESAYFLNDSDFVSIDSSCNSVLENSSKNELYCLKTTPVAGQFTTADMLKAIDFFDFHMPAGAFDDFEKKLYDQAFIKRTIKSDLLGTIFNNNAYVVERYEVIRSQVERLNLQSRKYELRLSALADNSLIGQSGDLELISFTNDMCCAVKLLHDEAGRIKAAANDQAQSLCKIRTEIGASVRTSTGSMLSLLAAPRIAEITDHISRFDLNLDSCKFVPSPLE